MMKIEVREKTTKTLLFSCPIEAEEKAYQYASEAESMGIEVELISPSVISNLAKALGASANDLQVIENSMNEEIENHQSCNSPSCSS